MMLSATDPKGQLTVL